MICHVQPPPPPPQLFIRSNIIPLPKDSKVDLSDSSNYRRISIGM